jgi:hypothetical protein
MTGQAVSVEDIFHYGITAGLDLCFKPGARPIWFKLADYTKYDYDREQEYFEVKKPSPLYDWRTNTNSLIGLPISAKHALQDNGEWAGAIEKITSVYGSFLFPEGFDDPMVLIGARYVDDKQVSAHFGRSNDDVPPTFTLTQRDVLIPRSELERFEQAHDLGQPLAETDTTETIPTEGRPWVHLINSPNPKDSALYKQDATRIRESLTAEERRTWAREAVARNGGNKTAAGRELAVSESCIRGYLPKK